MVLYLTAELPCYFTMTYYLFVELYIRYYFHFSDNMIVFLQLLLLSTAATNATSSGWRQTVTNNSIQ